MKVSKEMGMLYTLTMDVWSDGSNTGERRHCDLHRTDHPMLWVKESSLRGVANQNAADMASGWLIEYEFPTPS